MALVAVAAWSVAVALLRAWRSGLLKPAMTSPLTITAMIFATIITASVFALVFRGLGGDEHVEALLAVIPGGAAGSLRFVRALTYRLGRLFQFGSLPVIPLPRVLPSLP